MENVSATIFASAIPLAFDGEYCDQSTKANINPPRFNDTFYSATIVENSPVGTVILQVKANDTDSGRNGQIFYAILGDDNVESILTIGGQSGKVYIAKKLDFETIEMKSFNVTLVAADNGYPQKSGIATVQIAVMDENDNCPTFIEPPGDLKLEFLTLIPGETVTKISAIDLDSGVNSYITYSLSKNDAFSIDPKTGVVTVVSHLTKKVHYLTVSASDNGDVSCITDISLTVEIGVFPTTKARTRPTTPFSNRKSKTSSTSTLPESLPPTTEPRTRPTTPFTNRKSETSGTSTLPETLPPTTKPRTRPTTSFTNRKSETSATSTLPETTAFTGATTSHVPTEAGADPQEGPNYTLIGGSAAGGVLLLLIAVVVIRKCLCRNSTSSETTGRWNAGMDFEMSLRK
ncbi:protocadherin gamma-A4-like [Pocillopora damicornis]|uniref:protocadherin gamma-A4-like n=1 Tax=Pocillopora damicornis TaxID=46731 RepID=UPI000F5553AC|nr:protocadherin gamma-A4-like [Pocillopora damicornis]